jgi:hypothetical protein
MIVELLGVRAIHRFEILDPLQVDVHVHDLRQTRADTLEQHTEGADDLARLRADIHARQLVGAGSTPAVAEIEMNGPARAM